MNQFQKMTIVLAFFLLVGGVFGANLSDFHSLAAPTHNTQPANLYYSPVTFINIPSLFLGMPIFPGDNKVTQLGSTYPGQQGNIVFFGDNSDEVFGGILELSKGDEIIVVTKNGVGHEYVVDELLLLSPSDPRILEQTPLETLTLFTPAGFLDTKRFVIKAVPSSI